MKSKKLKAILGAVALATSVPMAVATPVATSLSPTAEQSRTVTRDVATNEKTRVQPRKNVRGQIGYARYGSMLTKPVFKKLSLGHPKRHFNKKRHGKSLRRAHARMS